MGIDSTINPPPSNPVATTRRRSPRFFKVFLPDLCSHRLEISPAFLKHIEGRFPGICSIVGPSGHVWRLELVGDGNGKVFFEGGWDGFVKDHCLQIGDFMVFEYLGERRFSVLVFDASACEKAEAFGARPGGENGSPVGGENRGRNNGGNLARKYGQCLDLHNNAAIKKTWRVLLSHRRPVTKEEIVRAKLKANLFKSENPFFVRAIRKSDIYFHNKMYVPKHFVDNHLPNQCTNFFLRNPSGKLYMVRLYNKRRDVYLTAGWRIFAFENYIEEDDACVFELIKENEFQVHIYRVVEQPTPLTWVYVNKLM